MRLKRTINGRLLLFLILTTFSRDLMADDDGRWEFYFRKTPDGLSSILYDVDAEKRIEALGHPSVLTLRITLRQPRADGLSSSDEFDRLEALEKELMAAAHKVRVIEAGRITGNGFRTFYFVGNGDLGKRQANLVSAASRAGYVASALIDADDGPSVFVSKLLPSATEQDEIGNRKVVENLEKNGDKLEAIRSVDHWLYFDTPADREACRKAVIEAGFEMVEISTDRKAEHPYALHIKRDAVPTWENMNVETAWLRVIAGRYQGVYDGWETSVEK